jgi:hypothetical protein
MSIKSKVLAAAATITLVGGVGAAGALSAGTASAATPSCGGSCINIFSHEYGTYHDPAFVVDTLRQGNKTGQPIILFRTSNSDPAEDFTLAYEGLTSDFLAAGLVSDAVALHYGCTVGVFGDCSASVDDPAFEVEYAPFGADSGLCVGVAATAFQDEGVTLQPCGVSSKTVWILDTNDAPITGFFTGTYPAINGSDTNFSQPFVLTYPNDGYPTDMPRPQLVVENLTGFSHGFSGGLELGTVDDNQLWGGRFGVLN